MRTCWTVSPVVLLVHQVVAGAEGDQTCVVGRRGDGHGARAADVRVAQLVGEDLEVVGGEAVVVPEDVVVRGPTGTLETAATALQHPHGDNRHRHAEHPPQPDNRYH